MDIKQAHTYAILEDKLCKTNECIVNETKTFEETTI